jgi:hypothetical protein
MVNMGGGPDTPSKKELVLCTLPWTDEEAKKGLEGLKEEFGDLEVKYYYTEHGKKVDVPQGMYYHAKSLCCVIYSRLPVL